MGTGQDHSGDLVARWREGDQQAAEELFRRYADRLIGLARSRLSAKLARRIDPEDVVQSVYRSFFTDSREGRYDLQRGGDLWRLLVAITLHKLHDQIRRNTRGKRTVEREQNLGTDEVWLGMLPHSLAHEPSPVEAVALAEELEQFISRLGPADRRVLELRLQGYTVEEIAAQTQRGERTVRRVLKENKQRLEQWYAKSCRA
jgi:RNA polymerase sigma factor (sigma-70 family)